MKKDSPVMTNIPTAINDIKGLRFQPIVFLDNDQTVAWEVLSWLQNKDPEEWFSSLSIPLYLAIFYWQVNEVNKRNGQYWLNLPVKVIRDPFSISHIIRWEHNNQLTIEIQDPETLLTLNDLELQQVKRGIARLKVAGWKVWLDDIKTHLVNDILSLTLNVDGIKIDRHEIHHPVTLQALISRSRLLSQNILVEGVETVPLKERAHQSGSTLGQGFLWPEVKVETSSQHALYTLISLWMREKITSTRNAVNVFFACKDRHFIEKMEACIWSIIESDYAHQPDIYCSIVNDISNADIAFMDNIYDTPSFSGKEDWPRVTTVLSSKPAIDETEKTLRAVISRIFNQEQYDLTFAPGYEKYNTSSLSSGKKTSSYLWAEGPTQQRGRSAVIS